MANEEKLFDLPTPKVWPEPVDGASLIGSIAGAIRRHVIMEDGGPEAIALWVLHTHTLDAFTISPRLAITSPARRCGKTALLDLLTCLVARPMATANITAAGVFRTVHKFHPTLLIDEADTFLAKSDELVGMLNSGHRKSTAYVTRLVGKEYDSKQFCTWCAVAIALIGGLPSTLADRSIEIRLRRRLPNEHIEPLRFGRTAEIDKLGQMAARWASDHQATLALADPAIPAGITNRAADNWATLLAIADVAGGPWPERARAIALRMVVAAGESENGSASEMLLSDVRDIWQSTEEDRLPSRGIADQLSAVEGRPWAEWCNGRALSPHALAILLNPFGIKPTTMRIGNTGLCKGYSRDQFGEVFSRYLS